MLVSQCNSIITIVQHDNALNDSNMSHFQQTFMLLLLFIPVQSSAVSNTAYMTLHEWQCQAKGSDYMKEFDMA